MPSLTEHLRQRDLIALVHDPRMPLLDRYLAELEGVYCLQATQVGDTDYAKGQLAAIKSLRKDLENLQLDTDAETGKLDT